MNLRKKIVPPAVLFLMIFLMLYLLQFFHFENDEELAVYFLDVGQGDAILIDAPNGEQLLIDAGRDEKVLNELTKVMNFSDKKIDALVISHADLDHIGGFFEVIDIYEVEKIIRSHAPIESEYEERLLQMAKQYGIEIITIKRGDSVVIDFENQIYFDVLWPHESLQEHFDRNENSLVFRLVFDESEFLFTGDSTMVTENKLIEYYDEQLASDVLKVGHHGSRTSTSKNFLEHVNPEFAIISSGKNSYGHPHQEVLDHLSSFGIETFNTKDRATIVARSNGKEISISSLDDSHLFNQPSVFQSFVSSLFINSFNSFR